MMRTKIRNNEIIIEVVEKPDPCVIKEIIDIEKESFGNGAVHEWVLAPFILCGKIIILKFNGKISGVSIFLKEFEKDSVFYFTLALLKEIRGKGIGKYFFEQSVNYIFSEYSEISRIRYTVDPDNKFNNDFFRRSGAVECDFFKDIYGPGIDRNYVTLTRESFYENSSF